MSKSCGRMVSAGSAASSGWLRTRASSCSEGWSRAVGRPTSPERSRERPDELSSACARSSPRSPGRRCKYACCQRTRTTSASRFWKSQRAAMARFFFRESWRAVRSPPHSFTRRSRCARDPRPPKPRSISAGCSAWRQGRLWRSGSSRNGTMPESSGSPTTAWSAWSGSAVRAPRRRSRPSTSGPRQTAPRSCIRCMGGWCSSGTCGRGPLPSSRPWLRSTGGCRATSPTSSHPNPAASSSASTSTSSNCRPATAELALGWLRKSSLPPRRSSKCSARRHSSPGSQRSAAAHVPF
mmetsp:Transcript_81317/g.263783  ORF Transcript_81317/g.263783 Transcript_81317/m.263783 type:complete len:295 (-) Transcript_81317:1032-1916(-)